MQLSECLLIPGAEQAKVINNIQHKQELLATGDPAHKDIRTALIIGGGAMRGVFSGGVVTGLQEIGLTEVFDDVVGVSVGASSAAYFLAGQARLGTTLFSEELTSKEFIDLARRGNILNVGYLEKIFTGKKALDQAAIRANRSDFWIGVTDINQARPEYLEVSHSEDKDIIRLIQGSSAVPGLAPPVVVDGMVYGDGITTCKNPIGFAIEELGATDVLCILNQPLRHDASSSIGDRILSALLTRSHSPVMRDAFRNRHEMSDEMATTTYNTEGVNIGVTCPPESRTVSRLERNSNTLIRAAQFAEQQTIDIFE